MRHGRRPDGMSDEQAAVYDFSTELMQKRRVSDATYARAQKLFGDRGVMDLVGLNGYYSLLAMAMNAVQMRNPEGAEELPPVG
jgi:4-carboxymuconolactone decarboxylase